MNTIQVTDYGTAMELRPEDKGMIETTMSGTIHYMAPEITKKQSRKD
jgi:serine/threonine protein kinase